MGKSKSTDTVLKILTYCRKKPAFTAQELCDDTGLDRTAVYRWLEVLTQAGWFLRENKIYIYAHLTMIDTKVK